MKKIIVKLIDGSVYEFEDKYCWTDFEKELNDVRNKFIKIKDLTVRIESVLSIETIDIDEPKEVETNE